jgi:uncharacterized repeat protein (TIGR04076 family)
MVKIKITVVRKMKTEEIFGNNAPKTSGDFTSSCWRFEEGAVFISEDGKMPEGFCPWAFVDIHRCLTHLRFDGEFPWMKEKGIIYLSCTDGLRPVIFKLERLKG